MRILLKNGKIYDGTGVDAFVGDVLVEDEKIVEVGPDLAAEADEVVDLEGLSISSGFFDAHSHNDWFGIKKGPLKYLESRPSSQATAVFQPWASSPTARTPTKPAPGSSATAATRPGSTPP